MTGWSMSFALLAGLFAAGCAETRPADVDAATADQSGHSVAKTGGQDEAIPLGEVPETVLKAAQAAIPGFTPANAEKEIEDGTTVYSIEGTAGGSAYEVEVTADGKVTEIEKGDAEEGGDAEEDEKETDDD